VSRAPRPTSQQAAAVTERAEKVREALVLKRSGLSYEDIQRQILGADGTPYFSSRQVVSMAVHRAMQAAVADLRHETIYYRAEAIDRLNALLSYAWPAAENGDVKAIAECRLIIESMSRLTGANAPTRIQIGESDVDATLRELDDEINRRAAAVEGEIVGPAIEARPDPDDLGG
jgi:hypothetical protein